MPRTNKRLEELKAKLADLSEREARGERVDQVRFDVIEQQIRDIEDKAP